MICTSNCRSTAAAPASRLLRWKGEAGTSLVEFALVCMLFLTLLFGISAFGHSLYAYHFLSHAAKEATRYAAVRGSTCGEDSSCAASNSASGTAGPATVADIQQFVRNAAPPGIDPDNITTTPVWLTTGPTICSSSSNAPGCTVKVQVSYSFSFLFPLVHSGPLTVSSSSEMVIVH